MLKVGMSHFMVAGCYIGVVFSCCAEMNMKSLLIIAKSQIKFTLLQINACQCMVNFALYTTTTIPCNGLAFQSVGLINMAKLSHDLGEKANH